MENELEQKALDRLFLSARTYHGWKEIPVSEEVLKNLYDMMRVTYLRKWFSVQFFSLKRDGC